MTSLEGTLTNNPFMRWEVQRGILSFHIYVEWCERNSLLVFRVV